MSEEDLTLVLKAVKKVYNETFTEMVSVWNLFPAAQWQLTFAQQMRHLQEYKDLRSAMIAFKEQFTGKSANAKNLSGQDRVEAVS